MASFKSSLPIYFLCLASLPLQFCAMALTAVIPRDSPKSSILVEVGKSSVRKPQNSCIRSHLFAYGLHVPSLTLGIKMPQRFKQNIWNQNATIWVVTQGHLRVFNL